MSRIGAIAAWVLAAALTSWVTYQGLSTADAEISDRPLTPVLVATSTTAPDGPPSSPPDATASTVTSAGGTSTTTSTTPGSGDDRPPASSTTTTTVVSSGSSTSTSSTTSTTSTTVPAAWKTVAVPSDGGTVVTSVRPYEVRLDAASPAAGFAMTVISNGPEEVRVRFESGDRQIEVRVRWKDGSLSTEVDEH